MQLLSPRLNSLSFSLLLSPPACLLPLVPFSSLCPFSPRPFTCPTNFLHLFFASSQYQVPSHFFFWVSVNYSFRVCLPSLPIPSLSPVTLLLSLSQLPFSIKIFPIFLRFSSRFLSVSLFVFSQFLIFTRFIIFQLLLLFSFLSQFSVLLSVFSDLLLLLLFSSFLIFDFNISLHGFALSPVCTRLPSIPLNARPSQPHKLHGRGF